MKRSPLKKGKGFSTSPEQQKKAREAVCIVCRQGPCDPAHLMKKRTLDKDGDPRHTIPLCRTHHRAYDAEGFDLLPYERMFPEESAFAVGLYGLATVTKTITNNQRLQL